MKLAGLDGDWLEIASADWSPDQREQRRDRRLLVAVQVRGFTGRAEAWILDEAWCAFLDDLAKLERDRQGAASLEAVSPDELRLSFRSTDAAGHVAVDGFVGARSFTCATKLAFSPMPFDPTELPRVLRELGAIER